MTNPEKLLKITTVNGYTQLYVDGMSVVKSISCVAMDGALWIVRDGYVALPTGKRSVIQLVESGKQVYLQS